jgi:RNA polymerase sigma-70 factor (sigma-E family)
VGASEVEGSTERVLADAVTRPSGRPRALNDYDFDSLYQGSWLGLVRLATLLLGDEAAAKDVVQDAFVNVYRRWSSLTDLPGARAYLRTAVVNGARSALRHRRTVRRLEQQRAPAADAIEDPRLERAEPSSMAAAFDALPRRQREVLVLRYWADLSEQDIARTLGISAGTVKSSAARGLANLKQALEDCDD